MKNNQLKDLIHGRTSTEQKLRNYHDQLESTMLELTTELSKIKETLVKERGLRKKAESGRRQIEMKLHRSEKMEAFGVLASGVAHDLNNILTGIVNYPELLLAKLDKSNELYQPLKDIHEAAKRAATVTTDLLTIARSAARDHSLCNLNTLAHEYFSSLEYQHLNSLSPGLIYRFNLEAERADILCSPVHVKNCIMNLIANAVEAIGSTGTITVSTYNMSEILNIEGSEGEVESVVISIHDDGPGITAKDQEHIFEPFYSTKQMGKSGSGLGLATVWSNMKNHNGNVKMKSDGSGTSFKLFFPIP